MAWHAKPSGAYSLSSNEGIDNILEMRDFLRNAAFNYTDEAITGVVANSIYEGGLNPWRWESDTYPPTSTQRGCGLFGFTPYGRYLNLPGANKMNLSVTTTTSGASPDVGSQQMLIMADGTWGWMPSCWRTYWDSSVYPDQYDLRRRVLDRYGSGSTLSQSQYARIDDIAMAVFAFLACFEGPTIPNYSARLSVANDVYQIITGHPPTPSRRGINIPLFIATGVPIPLDS